MRRLTFLLSLSVFGALFVAFPSAATASGSIGALSLDPDSVRGGASTTGTVDLGFPDPGATVVRLFSSAAADLAGPRSKAVASTPCAVSARSVARPAGPAPTTATLRPVTAAILSESAKAPWREGASVCTVRLPERP